MDIMLGEQTMTNIVSSLLPTMRNTILIVTQLKLPILFSKLTNGTMAEKNISQIFSVIKIETV